MKEAIISTLLHVLAVAVMLGVAWVLIQWLGIESPAVQSVIALVAVGLEKLMRALPSIPVGDYVNER